jgi:hypothetical protein
VISGAFGISYEQAEELKKDPTQQERLLPASARKRSQIASMQVITNVSPYESQLLNRFTRGMMLVASQTMLVLECTPAAYINLAANEAEKAACPWPSPQKDRHLDLATRGGFLMVTDKFDLRAPPYDLTGRHRSPGGSRVLSQPLLSRCGGVERVRDARGRVRAGPPQSSRGQVARPETSGWH